MENANTSKSDKWKWLRVVVYILVPAIILGWVASAVPALLNKPGLTNILGLAGAAVGAVAGFVAGRKRGFQ